MMLKIAPFEFQLKKNFVFTIAMFVSPKVDGSKWNPRPTPTHVLLPHEVLDSLAGCDPFAFQSIILGDHSDESRVDFFRHISRLEPWKHHPVINQCCWKKLVPIHIHGDGCEFYKEDEYFVWSWSSVFNTGGSIKDALMFRFPIAVIPERHMRKEYVAWCALVNVVIYLTINLCDLSFILHNVSFQPPFICLHHLTSNPSYCKVRAAVHQRIAEITTWSLKVAAEGVWPHKGFLGEEFAHRTPRYKKRGRMLSNGFKNLAE